MPLRWDIEAIDRPTVLYILYSTMSAQQTNLSHNDAIFPIKGQKLIWHISDHLAMLKFLWLCNHRIIYCNYWSLFRVLHVDICSCSSVCVPLIIVVQTWCVLVAMLSMVYCVYYTRPQGKSSKVRNMPLNACSK